MVLMGEEGRKPCAPTVIWEIVNYELSDGLSGLCRYLWRDNGRLYFKVTKISCRIRAIDSSYSHD